MIPNEKRLDNAFDSATSALNAMLYIMDHIDVDNHEWVVAMCGLRLAHETIQSAVTELDILTQSMAFDDAELADLRVRMANSNNGDCQHPAYQD